MGPNALHIESSLADSEPQHGYWEDLPLSIGEWRQVSGAALSTGSDPNVNVTNDLLALEWDAADTDAAIVAPALPGQFAEVVGDKVRFVCHAGLFGTGDNDDLDLIVTARLLQRGTGASDEIAASKVLVDGSEMDTPANGARLTQDGATPDGSQICVFEFDLSDYQNLDGLTFKMVPDQAPGSNNDLRVWATMLRYRRHASLPRADRAVID